MTKLLYHLHLLYIPRYVYLSVMYIVSENNVDGFKVRVIGSLLKARHSSANNIFLFKKKILLNLLISKLTT